MLQPADLHFRAPTARLGNRPHPVPLDPPSWAAVERCLAHRDGQRTDNPNVMVTRQTKSGPGPASTAYVSHVLDACGFPPRMIRCTQPLDLVNTMDPNHVAATFSMDPEATMIHLADHVADQPPLDYHAQRKRFANWTLSDSAMQKIVDNYPSRRRFIAGGSYKASRIGIDFSALIWSRLTGSEWRLAPDLQPLPREGVDVVDAAVISSLKGRHADQQPFYKYLHDLLPDYANTVLGQTGHNP
ncbi:hypothetical protein [Streptomyces sp. NPDC029003]|uniref:hypothetical protein n=1 Tax=Streptomyces sp. NPDC029003 TaxID=3155125 RepID=UPI00340169F1